MTPALEREALRYLGYHGKAADADTLKKLRTVMGALEAAVTPRSVWRRYPASVQGNAVVLDGEAIESASLARHLAGCDAAYLFAATLGVAADNFLRRLAVSDMAAAAVGQAAAAALIEQYCDAQQAVLEREVQASGSYLRPRFSPGYGDFSLEYQRSLFRRLMPEKHIGVTLTDSLLMVPMKSVSAVLGVSASPQCSTQKCRGCENTSCAFRAAEEEQ